MNKVTSNKPALSGTSSRLREAIILAGGLGTRLRSVVADLPKCMAPVAGRPFLFYVINFLRLQGIEKFIFSLGYKHEIIEEYLNDQFSTLSFQCSVEEEPLGTGGAIRLACQLATEKNVLIVNGDTLFKIDIVAANAFHENQNADCTLALKPMNHFDRYGAVGLHENGLIADFKEKQSYEKGLINGGVYFLNAEKFLTKNFPAQFSFEKDYLEKYLQQDKITGFVQDSYFIDIGIPEDYSRVQEELKNAPLDLQTIDQSWTLFLDRDGVLNHDKVGSYIFNPDEFVFYDGVPAVFKRFKQRFGRIVIATNQRGVGRNLMTVDDLDAIHQKMQAAIEAEDGKIDAIFYATSIHNNDVIRKPNPGMALKAKEKFPEIDFTKSIMVGNNISDMEFGRNAGMYCIFLTTTIPHVEMPHPAIDMIFNSLTDFAKAL